MEFLILNTKIIPEQRQLKIIARPSLVKSLLSNSDKTLICVESGAGYGKTTIVNEFLNSSKFSYSWYKIDKSDNNIFLFFTYIIHSIRVREKLFGKNTLELIRSLKSRANLKSDLSGIINTIVVTFLNEFIQAFNKNFYIVLDDFHLLQNEEWVSKSILQLLENAPKNFHIIITSRQKLPFDLASLKAKRKYYELNSEDLKFNEEEIKLLSKEIYDKTFDEELIKQMYNKFEGWVTGLHLFLQSAENQEAEEIETKIPQNLYDFFAEDIFNAKSEQNKTFLINTCVLDNFTPETCNFILNISESENILNGLLNRNVFIKKQIIQQKKNSIVSYNYQDLFKDFLLSKFNELRTPEEKKTHYHKIAEYYISSEDYINSIKYLLLAEDYNKSVELILANISAVIDTGNLTLINDWLSLLPDDYKSNNPMILYYLGSINRNFYGNMEEALKCYNNALNFLKPSDKTYIVKTNTQIAEILINIGNVKQARENLTELLKKKLDEESKAYILYWMAVCSNYFSDYDESLKLLHQSLDLLPAEAKKSFRNNISNELGNIYLIRGDFVKSLFHYENVINNTKNIYKKFQTLVNIVQLYSHSGQFDKAKKTLDEAAEIELIFPTPFFKINYLVSEAHMLYMVGDFEMTISVWNELLILVKKSNMSYYIYLAYLSMGCCYFYLKNYMKAEQYYEMAKEFIDELNEMEKIDFRFSYAVLQKEINFSEKLEKDFKDAYEYFEKNGMIYNKVQAGLHLADFYRKIQSNKEAKKYLEESLMIISANEYISYALGEIFSNRDLFYYAIQNKIQTDFIFNLFSTASSLILNDWISEEYRTRLGSEIDKFFDIKLECFGGIKIKKRGEPVEDDKWIRKNRKLIFAYIMLNHKKNLTMENIVNLFFPESTPENARSAFHQTMSNVRSVFNFKVESTDTKNTNAFISFSDKIIQLSQYYFYYIDTTEFEKLYKKAIGYGIPETEKIKYIKQAIEIYKGNFLEGYYHSWCEQLREKYSDMALRLLDEIIDIYKSRKEYENIILYSEKLLLSDNLNEDAYINIIESEVKLGNTPLARKTYEQMIETFKTELKQRPSQKTIDKITSFIKI